MDDPARRSPEIDPFLQSDGYQNYGLDLEGLWTGKQACKAALQRELGLPEDPYACMLGGAVCAQHVYIVYWYTANVCDRVHHVCNVSMPQRSASLFGSGENVCERRNEGTSEWRITSD